MNNGEVAQEWAFRDDRDIITRIYQKNITDQNDYTHSAWARV